MNPLLRRWASFVALSTAVVFFLYSFADSNGYFESSGSVDSPPLPLSSHINWKDVPQQHPIESLIPLPTGVLPKIPQIQANFPDESTSERKERVKRQTEVKNTFLRAWKGYKKHAWLQDEVHPVSGAYNNKYGGWGATLVDNLDTLIIMGLEKEFVHATAALHKIDYTTSQKVEINVFETTIRHLGGLLSAHDLDHGKHPILLEKAKELGETLYAAFDTPNRLPMSRWLWGQSAFKQDTNHEASIQAVIAEVGSLSLEFTRLSQLTGDPRYYDAVQRITDMLEKQQNSTKIPGLWPVLAHSRKGLFTMDRTFTFGAMADSLYEYFPKQHLILGGLKDQYQNMYQVAIETAKERLFYRPMTPNNQDILLSGTAKFNSAKDIQLDAEGQHLTCFVGGMVGLASKIFNRPDELEIAKKLVDGCVWAYGSMPTGIMPEVFHTIPCEDSQSCNWNEDIWYKEVIAQAPGKDEAFKDFRAKAKHIIKERKLPPGFTAVNDARYLLRPEAIESVFILYRITGDKAFQDAAWEMFQAVKDITATAIGAAGIRDVRNEASAKLNECESFWMAETLKYYYLIFSEPDLVSLDEFVFNTEAHPLRRPQAGSP